MLNTHESELDAARREIARLKEQKGHTNGTATDDDISANISSESHLIISLKKQLESECLNSRNLKQQLELERVYASRITDKHNFLYNKLHGSTSRAHPNQQNTSTSSTGGGVGATTSSTSLLGGAGVERSSQNCDLESSDSMNLGFDDSFGLRGLQTFGLGETNNNTQRHQPSHSESDHLLFEGLITGGGGNDVSDVMMPLSQIVKQPSPSIATSSPLTSRHLMNGCCGSGAGSHHFTLAESGAALKSTASPSARLSTLQSQHQSFTRSDQLISLNRSNSTGNSATSKQPHFYSVPPPSNLINLSGVAVSGIGSSGVLSLTSLDGLESVNSRNSGGLSGRESSLTSLFQSVTSTIGGGKGLSPQKSADSPDVFNRAVPANLRSYN